MATEVTTRAIGIASCLILQALHDTFIDEPVQGQTILNWYAVKADA